MLILDQHDHSKPPIGTLEMVNDRLIIKLARPLTRPEFFQTFGNVGVVFKRRHIAKDNSETIQEAEIVEFSVSPLMGG